VSVASELGLRIRVARTRQRLTQEGLAEAAGLHPTYISGVETGKRQISVKVLLRIALALETPASEFLVGIEDFADPGELTSEPERT
jgi:transcriptional regulator with XRE-family HTH domain